MDETKYFADFPSLAALNEHLQELRPIFDAFSARNEFVYAPRLSIGRYPRIRINRERLITLYFDLSMELDEKGCRFEVFRHDLPYRLDAGAIFVEDDGSKYGTWFHQGVACFTGKPFDRVGAVLEGEMQKYLHILEAWDVRYLKENGKKVRPGG